MILREGAVLLVIGAAVIGPIPSKMISSDGFVTRAPHDGPAYQAPFKPVYETTDETCTRAMKEIGAKNFNAGNGQPDTGNVWTYPDGTTAFYDQPMHRIGKVYGPGHIVCIASPTGMK